MLTTMAYFVMGERIPEPKPIAILLMILSGVVGGQLDFVTATALGSFDPRYDRISLTVRCALIGGAIGFSVALSVISSQKFRTRILVALLLGTITVRVSQFLLDAGADFYDGILSDPVRWVFAAQIGAPIAVTFVSLFDYLLRKGEWKPALLLCLTSGLLLGLAFYYLWGWGDLLGTACPPYPGGVRDLVALYLGQASPTRSHLLATSISGVAFGLAQFGAMWLIMLADSRLRAATRARSNEKSAQDRPD